MEVPIYVDVLFVINLFINYFLLLLSAKFSYMKINRWKILFGSAIGGIYSCVIFFCTFSPSIILLTKILSALVIVYVSFTPKTQKDIIRVSLIFTNSNLILGGICYALYFIFTPLNMTFRNSVVYFNFSPVFLILTTIVVYLIVVLFDSVLKPRHLHIDKDYLVTIHHNRKICTLNGFVDTGNNLTDFFTNTPIVVCSYDSIEKILDEKERYVFKNFSKIDDLSIHIDKIRIIPVNTVNSGAFLPAFAPEKIVLKNSEKTYLIKNVLIAVSNENHLKQEPIILNPNLIYE